MWPHEACGIFVLQDGEVVYRMCDNLAEDPTTDFRIGEEDYQQHVRDGTLQAVFHSHPAGQLEPSHADMESQIAMDVPFFVCTLSDKGAFLNFWGWGAQLPIDPLLSRPFRSGVTDCYAAVRDFHRVMLGQELPDFPRDPDWWDEETVDNPFEAWMTGPMFEDVRGLEDIQIGDGLLFALKNDVIMHCGVYIGDGLFLHHLHGKISKRDPVIQWRRFIRRIVRYRKDQ